MNKGFLIVALYTFLASNCLAQDNLYNPLLSYKEQLKILHRDCKNESYNKDCEALEKKLSAEMLKLKEVCKTRPEDERCGAVMKERKEVNSWETFCQENPHAKKCVVRRTRAHRREKLKRLFCTKNPEEKRCENNVKDKSKRGFAYFCKANPENRRCKVLAERKAMNEPPKEADKNLF